MHHVIQNPYILAIQSFQVYRHACRTEISFTISLQIAAVRLRKGIKCTCLELMPVPLTGKHQMPDGDNESECTMCGPYSRGREENIDPYNQSCVQIRSHLRGLSEQPGRHAANGPHFRSEGAICFRLPGLGGIPRVSALSANCGRGSRHEAQFSQVVPDS